MRLLKTRGGFKHGRSITPAVQAKAIYSLREGIPLCNALEKFCDIETQSSDQHIDMRPTSAKRDREHMLKFKGYISQHSPFAYDGPNSDKLVCISNGVVGHPSANADKAFEIGEQSAIAISGCSFADVKLKRNDKITSIGSAVNSVKVRDKEIEVDSTNLLLRMSCATDKKSDMKANLSYEYDKHPPALFKGGSMRKNNKSDLARELKSNVQMEDPNIVLRNPIRVFDGGYLLHLLSWMWINGATYDEICNGYVQYVVNFSGEKYVIFDGYRSRNSTKVSEQLRRVSPNTAADIIFTGSTVCTDVHGSFLENKNNKARLIDMLIPKFRAAGVTCVQARADADHLICQTALSASQAVANRRPVILHGTDTDLLTMLVHGSKSNNIYIRYENQVIYNIAKIKRAAGMRIFKHILVLHAITGCDTVSACVGCGKKRGINVLNNQNWRELYIFQDPKATHEEIARIGEKFLLALYGAPKHCKSLDELRYLRYMQRINKASTFHIKDLPPTSAAAAQHNYRVYFTVQEWMGNAGDLEPTDWGWMLVEGCLTPIPNTKPFAPEKVINIISCACKKGCNKRCSCRKAGLKCSSVYTGCNGQTCDNKEAGMNDEVEGD